MLLASVPTVKKLQLVPVVLLALASASTFAFGQAPEKAVQEIRLAAEQGDARAQYALGLIYHNGEGVPQDFVEAHKWLNLAAAKDSRDAKTRDAAAAKMTREQIAEAQRLAREWKPKTWEELKAQVQ